MGLKYFFLDTYAMHELAAGNPDYKKFMTSHVVTTKLNLMELYYTLARNTHKKFAERFYDYFLEFSVEPNDETIKQAMNFRLNNKKKKLSYVDCVGYIMARKNNSLFLTGDKEFEGLEGVEFVK